MGKEREKEKRKEKARNRRKWTQKERETSRAVVSMESFYHYVTKTWLDLMIKLHSL